jgi:hypothetical protein
MELPGARFQHLSGVLQHAVGFVLSADHAGNFLNTALMLQ